MPSLISAESLVMQAVAFSLRPPPPPDISRWCAENIVFDERSPMPGPFDISLFPFLKEIHEVLSPEHASREVTIRGSAQWGKTASIIQPVLGAWHEYTPLDSLVVHPTSSSASEWVDNKWLPMRRTAPCLKRIFGMGGGDNKDAKFNQETLARDGSLKVASAGSPADLTGTTRRLVIMDDLSKFEMNDKGDPEALATSRAAGFEDAKILRVSTPMIKGTCRISRAFDRSDQRYYHVPCPHCGHEAPLEWDNFRKNIDPEKLPAAHFTCDACGCTIDHGAKEEMVSKGRWVARNPGGDHPGFHLWRAYAPQRDWASIAIEYAQVMGWSSTARSGDQEDAIRQKVAAETEQTFWNDVLGQPFEQASGGPDWEALRDRVETGDTPETPLLDRGILPSTGFVLTAGVDCQDDRLEVHLVAYGKNYRRWVIDYFVIPHHIGDKDGRIALDALLKNTWRTQLGRRIGIDMMAIDAGAFTEDVWSFAKRYPWSKVIVVKGASTQNGPIMQPMRFERRNDGVAKRRQKRGFIANVSQMKADFYAWLEKEDSLDRGAVSFARALGDEYYRQITAEVRVLRRARSGVVTSGWELVSPGRRNEGLDTMLYSELAARRKGWAANTDLQWEQLAMVRAAPPDDDQADLFDATAGQVEPEKAPEHPKEPKSETQRAGKNWMPTLGKKKGWFD